MKWIKLYCEKWFLGSTRWELSPEERSVWIDLIARAGLNDPPGQIDFFSYEQLATLFNVSQQLIHNCIEKFTQFQKIAVNSISPTSHTIKILNWDKYQSGYRGFRSQSTTNIKNEKKCQSFNIKNMTQNRIEEDIYIEDIYIKERKYKKKEKKHKYGEYQNVKLTDTEYQKLINRFGEEEAKAWIKRLDEGIALKGYKYKSHYLAILKWKEKEQQKPDKLSKCVYDNDKPCYFDCQNCELAKKKVNK